MKLKMLMITSLLLLLTLLLFQSASAMVSSHYAVEWSVPLTGTGGAASSPHFAVEYTVGQSATGTASSSHFTAGLGFWAAVWNWFLHLPIVLK